MVSKSFYAAVLLSLAGHALLGSVFTIVINPAGMCQIKSVTVNFLGPLLLEDAAMAAISSKEPFLLSVQSERHLKFADKMTAKLPELEKIKTDENARASSLPAGISMLSLLSEKRLMPSLVLQKNRSDYEPMPSQMRGPAASRQVIFKPQLPPLVRWPERIESDLDVDSFEVEVKFWVSSAGKVEFVEKMSSCGYPEIDMMAIRYMRMWRFSPLEENAKEPQWGRIKLNFRQLQ